MRLLSAALLAAFCTVPVAEARMHHPYRAHRIVAASQAPLNNFAQPSEAYSFRLLRQAYLGAGAAVRLRRASDNQQADIGFSGNGDFDSATAATFCAATTCFLTTWYDQSGNNRHAVQATAANQPQYIANCIGALPCARASGAAGAQNMTVAARSSATGTGTFSAVARRGGGTDYCTVMQAYYGTGTASRLMIQAGGDQWFLEGGGGSIFATAAASAWHAVVGVVGAGAVLRVDETETAGTIAGAANSGTLYMVSQYPNTTCEMTEAVHWDGYLMPQAGRAVLTANQKEYWTPFLLDNFAAPAAAYSFRRLKSTYSGPAVRLRRADAAEQDIGYLGYVPGLGAPFDSAAANAFCTSACTVATIYDQSGNARHLTNPAASQPDYVPNCSGSSPCMRTVGSKHLLGASVTPSAAGQTLSAVARVDGAAQTCNFINAGQQTLGSPVAATAWVLVAGGASFTATAGMAAFHAGVGVVSGASSVLRIDAVETAVPLAVSTVANTLYVAYGAGGSNTCSLAESIWWDGYAMPAGERAVLTANQKSFWGTP